MRVLQLISTNGFYGAENVVTKLSSELRVSIEFASIAVFDASSLNQKEQDCFEKASSLGFHDLRWTRRFDLSGFLRLVRLIRSLHIDVLHCHGYKADIIGSFASLVTSIKLVATCHNWTNVTTSLIRNSKLDLLVLRRFDRVVAVSNTVHSVLRSSGIAFDRLAQVDNGIDVAAFSQSRETGSRRNQFVIGAVARLSREKGIDVLLRAMPDILMSHPKTICRMIGDGPERERLVELAASLGISEECRFEGFCSDVSDFLQQCTLIVMPSRTEGMPMALLEAMASRVPVVATRVGSVGTLLLEGQAGVLIPRDSPKAVADAVTMLFDDPSLCDQLTARAYDHVRERFDTARMAREYLHIYRTLGIPPSTAPATAAHCDPSL